ncbi:hypothetical protein [Mesorhizobium kowhaii]|jgi:hypothetical protein|uniref:hypothetical protein n=1 Tax=Mesorhizobium kowhaii TaxID=1300272 RepID=UPI001FDFB6A9|nr:hypothetical protein [Mesorhizobium kowhaii]
MLLIVQRTLGSWQYARIGLPAFWKIDTHWFGDRIGHADIAHPGLASLADFPPLEIHAARMEALPVSQTVMQPFIAPA